MTSHIRRDMIYRRVLTARREREVVSVIYFSVTSALLVLPGKNLHTYLANFVHLPGKKFGHSPGKLCTIAG